MQWHLIQPPKNTEWAVKGIGTNMWGNPVLREVLAQKRRLFLMILRKKEIIWPYSESAADWFRVGYTIELANLYLL